MSMSTDEQDSDFYSDPDSTPSRSRPSDFTTDDDNHQPGSLVTPTSFDAYFLHASQPSRTSSNVFSHLVQPLSADEFAASLSRTFYPLPFPATTTTSSSSESATTSDAPAPPQARQDQGVRVRGQATQLLQSAHHHHHHHAQIPRYLLELAEGFNLIFYGFGSKRRALNDLARACASTAPVHVHGHGHGQHHHPPAHVLVLNGFLPSFSQRAIVAALARLPAAPQTVQAGAQ